MIEGGPGMVEKLCGITARKRVVRDETVGMVVQAEGGRAGGRGKDRFLVGNVGDLKGNVGDLKLLLAKWEEDGSFLI